MKKIIPFSLLVSFFVFNLQIFAQQKIKAKSNETKLKVKASGSTEKKQISSNDNFLHADSIQEFELLRISNLWNTATVSRDSTALLELMAPEYKLLRPAGGKPTYLTAWLDNLYHHLNVSKWEQSNMQAQVYGDVGIVTSQYAWAGTFHNNSFDSKGYLIDVWLRRNNKWQVVSRTSGVFEGYKTKEGK